MIDSSRGLIANHWRGNFPLKTAFWQHTVVLPSMITVGSLWCLNVSGHGGGPLFYVSAALLVTLWIVSVWALRGTFKSASFHVARGGRRIWKNVAIAVLVVNMLILLMSPVGFLYLLACSYRC